MRNYVERAMDFVKEVFPYICDCKRPTHVNYKICDFNSDYHRAVQVSYGLARVALITSDYVVKWDYDPEAVQDIGGCEDEVALYAEAEAEGFAYLLAKITRYTYHGRNFYIMPKVNGIGTGGFDYADDFMTERERDWCLSHHISDLHSNNYGFINGQVCIVDYACRDDYGTDE